MPSFDLEDSLRKKYPVIIGVDEVGCGPWAGPLVAASCYIDPNLFPQNLRQMINDSKKMTQKKREEFVLKIKPENGISIWHGIGVVDIEEFNQVGLKKALPLVIQRAVDAFSLSVDHVLIDGIRNPNLNIPTTMVIKGDQKSYSIAAASIIAKVFRDNMMQELHQLYPHYQWDKNAGYGTKSHIDAICQFGISPHHRICYKPIQKFLNVD
ncbi:MAG: ribonuclease HII [Proteobacteria bacterium]|nr:ribonuclease HII [Pseudomonadota bacterium]